MFEKNPANQLALKATHKGTLATIVSREEADQYVIYTYLMIGDIISPKSNRKEKN